MKTQAEIDKAYDEGKAAWFRAIGTHGPTLRPMALQHPPNPYAASDEKLKLAWQRGYNQDTRRVVADAPKPFVLPEMRFTVDVLKPGKRKGSEVWKPIVGGWKAISGAEDYGNKYCRTGRWRIRDREEFYTPEAMSEAKRQAGARE